MLDLSSNESVIEFAKAFARKHERLHVLVNNAGVNFIPESYTDRGVGMLAQVNFLGPAVLTRCLEGPLRKAATVAVVSDGETGGDGGPFQQGSKKNLKKNVAVVVNVSSVTHRYASVYFPKSDAHTGASGKNVSCFLTSWSHGSYAASKLANVVFANECQRRWNAGAAAGAVRSVAVDPGAVFSSLWSRDAFFSKPSVAFVLRALYAPPEDGATTAVLACLEPFRETPSDASASSKRDGAVAGIASDERFRFYARGLFASRLVARCGPGDSRECTTRLAKIAWLFHLAVWGLATVTCSALDWPARRLAKKAPFFFPRRIARNFFGSFEVPSSPGSYDERTGAALWEAAGKAAGIS